MATREVFISPQLDSFIVEPTIHDYLQEKGNLTILNYEEFMKWYSKINESIIPTQEDIITGLVDMTTIVCKNVIGKKYAKKAINNLMSKPDSFDFIAVVTNNYKDPITTIEEIISVRNNTILSYIIIQKGECSVYPDEYAISLICSRKIIVPGTETTLVCKASILISAYLYCLKKIGKTMGLLELADGYSNLQGFYSYSRLGFEKDMTLYTIQCFDGIDNLPMSVKLIDYAESEIVSNTITTERYHDIILRDTTGLIILKPIIEKILKIASIVATTIAKEQPSYMYKAKYNEIYYPIIRNITTLSLLSNLMYKLEGADKSVVPMLYTGNPVTQLKANLIGEFGVENENYLLYTILDGMDTTDKNKLTTWFNEYQLTILNGIENEIQMPATIKIQVNKVIEDVKTGTPIIPPDITQTLIEVAKMTPLETEIMEKEQSKLRPPTTVTKSSIRTKKNPGCMGNACSISGGKKKRRTLKKKKKILKKKKRTFSKTF